ncbi:hypothetical protein TrVE_jg14078 [Triparma verrucosa]|uniref:Uncharacterized protein n=1 Tax=Triparma verrucosa TaxID=1606542 RepID=A0A9W7BYK8_9STRA|nr:hypothetical protein TrVE_jg14078 [Triparma verrucosa]
MPAPPPAPPLPPGVVLSHFDSEAVPEASHPPAPNETAPTKSHLDELLTLALDLLSASRDALSMDQISTSESYNRMAHAVLVKLGKWVDTAYIIKDEDVDVVDDEEVENEKMKAAASTTDNGKAPNDSGSGGGSGSGGKSSDSGSAPLNPDDVVAAVAGSESEADKEMMEYLKEKKDEFLRMKRAKEAKEGKKSNVKRPITVSSALNMGGGSPRKKNRKDMK